MVPDSGLHLRPAYARFDAARAFPIEVAPAREPKGCRCGEVLRGVARPTDCPLFQQAYEEMGGTGRYFNDRLVEVIA